jgi:hypothetical protein
MFAFGAFSNGTAATPADRESIKVMKLFPGNWVWNASWSMILAGSAIQLGILLFAP